MLPQMDAEKEIDMLLGIDIGTSACKIAVFREDGKVVAQSSQPYSVYYPRSGWAEQDADEWWNAVCAGIREVLAQDGVRVEDIRGIGVDGQSWSAIPVDRNGNALARTPIWMDNRCRDICERVKAGVGGDSIFRIAGNMFLPSYSTPKMLWFKEERPGIYEKTDRFLQSNSYIVLKLTGVLSQDLSQSYGVHFFDINTLCYNDSLAKKLGLSTELAPPLYRCDQIVGTVSRAAADQTGLRTGTPVVAGGLDAACGALGAGVYKNGQTQEQGGQAGGMSICTSRAVSHKKLILSPHVVPGAWLLQGGSVGGGGALKWFRREFGGGRSFDALTSEAAEIPAGSEGVLFLPYMSGERSPIWNPDAKGVFYGLGFDKTRGHMIRAVLEGVAFSLEHNLRTAAETGVEIGALNAVGGASNSILWTQIKADVTGRTVHVPASDTAAALGAALLAGVGCGIYKDYEEATAETVAVIRTQEPDMRNHTRYRRSMELYLELYESLSGMFCHFGDNI